MFAGKFGLRTTTQIYGGITLSRQVTHIEKAVMIHELSSNHSESFTRASRVECARGAGQSDVHLCRQRTILCRLQRQIRDVQNVTAWEHRYLAMDPHTFFELDVGNTGNFEIPSVNHCNRPRGLVAIAFRSGNLFATLFSSTLRRVVFPHRHSLIRFNTGRHSLIHSCNCRQIHRSASFHTAATLP